MAGRKSASEFEFLNYLFGDAGKEPIIVDVPGGLATLAGEASHLAWKYAPKLAKFLDRIPETVTMKFKKGVIGQVSDPLDDSAGPLTREANILLSKLREKNAERVVPHEMIHAAYSDRGGLPPDKYRDVMVKFFRNKNLRTLENSTIDNRIRDYRVTGDDWATAAGEAIVDMLSSNMRRKYK